MTKYDSNNGVNLLPITNNMKEIEEITSETVLVLRQQGIKISNPETIPLISYQFILQMAKFLGKNLQPGKETSINFANLIEMGVSQETMEGCENDGNVTPFVSPGVGFKMAVKNDKMSADQVLDDEEI